MEDRFEKTREEKIEINRVTNDWKKRYIHDR